jgi:hypothetical protein
MPEGNAERLILTTKSDAWQPFIPSYRTISRIHKAAFCVVSSSPDARSDCDCEAGCDHLKAVARTEEGGSKLCNEKLGDDATTTQTSDEVLKGKGTKAVEAEMAEKDCILSCTLPGHDEECQIPSSTGAQYRNDVTIVLA